MYLYKTYSINALHDSVCGRLGRVRCNKVWQLGHGMSSYSSESMLYNLYKGEWIHDFWMEEMVETHSETY